MDDHERELLRSTVGQVLSDTGGDDAIDALAALGWNEVFAAEPFECTAVAFAERGRRLATVALLDAAVLSVLDRDVSESSVVLQTARGAVIGSNRATSAPTVVALTVDGPSRGAVREFALATCACEPIIGLEEPSVLTRVTLPSSPDAGAAPVTEQGELAARIVGLAHAAEILGASAKLLADVCDYVRERNQFGRPIGEFQAVKHRLAACHVAQEAARVAVEHACHDSSWAAIGVARALAGRAGAITVVLAPHVMGAMGFVWEVDIHRYHKRILAIDAIAGPWDCLALEIGRTVIESGTLERMGAA